MCFKNTRNPKILLKKFVEMVILLNAFVGLETNEVLKAAVSQVHPAHL